MNPPRLSDEIVNISKIELPAPEALLLQVDDTEA